VVTSIKGCADLPDLADEFGLGGFKAGRGSAIDLIPAVIPAKQLHENSVTTLGLSNKGLCVDGGPIVAARTADRLSLVLTRVLF
jgi:hypothetical protein